MALKSNYEDKRNLRTTENSRTTRMIEREKICRFCENHTKSVDFKNAELLRKYQTEKGKILSRRITGNCITHQRMLAAAVKRARILGLVL